MCDKSYHLLTAQSYCGEHHSLAQWSKDLCSLAQAFSTRHSIYFLRKAARAMEGMDQPRMEVYTVCRAGIPRFLKKNH